MTSDRFFLSPRRYSHPLLPAICPALSPTLGEVPTPPCESTTPEALTAEGAHSDAPSITPTPMPIMVVTGTRTERALTEAPIRTEVIASQETGVGAVSKLSEALEFATGLRVESTCQNCHSAEVQMLGLPQRYSAILIDGLPILRTALSADPVGQPGVQFLSAVVDRGPQVSPGCHSFGVERTDPVDLR